MNRSDVQMINVELCPVCNRADKRSYCHAVDILRDGRIYKISECKSCFHKFTDPCVSERDIGGFYTDNYYTKAMDPSLVDGRQIFSKVKGFFSRFIPTHNYFSLKSFGNGRLLDVGCGNGNFFKIYTKLGWDCTGMDPDVDALEIATRLNPDVTFISDSLAAHSSESDKTYSAIVFSHVLEHTYNPISQLQAAKALLASNGKIIVMVPNADCLEAKIFGRFWRGYEAPTHIQHFSPRSIRQLATLTGLRVSSLSPQSLPMCFVDSLFASLQFDSNKKSLGKLKSFTYFSVYLPLTIFSFFGHASAIKIILEVDE